MAEHICLDPNNHKHFLDSFHYKNIRRHTRKRLVENGVEIDMRKRIVHFPKGGIHPGHNRKMVMFPNDKDEIISLHHWQLPDGTVIRYRSDEGLLHVTKEAF